MFLTQFKGPDGERFDMVAIGGTLFGNALSMAAARATMLEVLTPEAYAHTQRLGARLADGHARERRARRPALAHPSPRPALRLHVPAASRSATPPRVARAPTTCSRRLIRIWMANRGVWEAIVGAGPVVPVPATDEDVDAYVGAWDELLTRLTT